MNKIFVLMLEGDYQLTSNTLYCLGQNKNIEVHVVSRMPNSPFRFSGYVRTHNYLSAQESEEKFLRFIEEVVRKTKSKVFFPISIEGVSFAVKHHSVINKFINIIPIPNREQFEIAADKSLFANFMIGNNLPVPKTIFNLEECLEEKLQSFPFPVLLKPKEGGGGKSLNGGHDITPFSNKADLLQFLAGNISKEDYIIQNRIEGPVLGCNVLYKDGKLISYSIQKGLIPAMKSFEPSGGIEFFNNEEAITVVDEMMSKLKWNGLANIDLIIDIKEKKIKVLEINPRVWMTIIGSMIAAKINFPAMACKIALDMPVETISYVPGRYIPITDYFRYKYKKRVNGKVDFRYKDINIKYTVVNLIPKLVDVYNKRENKK